MLMKELCICIIFIGELHNFHGGIICIICIICICIIFMEELCICIILMKELCICIILIDELYIFCSFIE